MSIKLVFKDGDVECETKADAKNMICQKLGVAKCTALRYYNNGTTDFSNFYRNSTKWSLYYVILEGEAEARKLSWPEIMDIIEKTGYVMSANDRQRIYRRLKKLNGRTISISELTSAPVSPACAGRMGSDVSAKRALSFDGVEGHSAPVTASQLRRDWNAKLSLGALYKRLKAGLRTRRDLLQPRLERELQGRKKGSFRPTKAPRAKAVKQAHPKPEISAEEIAAFKPAPTRELPPMNTYTPPKPGYRRGT